jgi:hypothetical protein
MAAMDKERLLQQAIAHNVAIAASVERENVFHDHGWVCLSSSLAAHFIGKMLCEPINKHSQSMRDMPILRINDMKRIRRWPPFSQDLDERSIG